MSKIDRTLPKGKWQFDEDVTNVFDNMLERSIPEYKTMRALVGDLVYYYSDHATTIIDIGCSNGTGIADMKERNTNNCDYVGYEISKPMVDVAREKFKKLFSGPLFPKGTGGLLPKYDEALKRKQASVEEGLPISKPKKAKAPDAVMTGRKDTGKSQTVKANKTDKKPKTFAEAFKAAKGQKTFTFKGKSYARVTKDELEKRGFKSLRAYLNAQKTTRVAKK